MRSFHRDNTAWITNAMLIDYLPEDLHDLVVELAHEVNGIWLMWVSERGLQPVIWPGLMRWSD